MDIATLLVAILLGGGGVLGAIYNWYTFRSQTEHQRGVDTRQRQLDYLESFRREATAAEQRGDVSQRDLILREYERQEQAYRVQLQLEGAVPPERL